mmetsp:Transcript_37983/g.41987  ORF Transcript_37983/g.41987 Transcript_37983/m.41987 type:complete len:196 (+) Transcript_37983:1239-1826(+)
MVASVRRKRDAIPSFEFTIWKYNEYTHFCSPRRNAVAATAMDKDNDIGCLVVTGSSNNKFFAAGADISKMSSKSFTDAYKTDMFAQWQNIASDIQKPIIAAVNGYALGGGCELAMMCDMIPAGNKAQFGQPEMNLGIIPGAGGTQRLTQIVGKSKATYMCLTGEHIGAEETQSLLVPWCFLKFRFLILEMAFRRR